jgi:hypothetical protein
MLYALAGETLDSHKGIEHRLNNSDTTPSRSGIKYSMRSTEVVIYCAFLDEAQHPRYVA